MKPNRITTWLAGLVTVALVASVGLNVFLFWWGQGNYLDLNRTRLDPLGLEAYSVQPQPGAVLPDLPIVVFFGDSRAQAWPAPPGLSGLQFFNRGIDAQTTAQVLGRFEAQVAPLHPTAVVVQVGINDLKTIPLFPDQRGAIVQRCEENLRSIVERSRQSGAAVVLTTIFPTGQVPIERRLVWSDDVAASVNEVNAYIDSLAGEGVLVFDSWAILADGRGMAQPDYSKDLLHYNEAGYAALNVELFKTLARFEK